MDKNQLEQRALKELGRDQLDRAIHSFIEILKQDPRDRRIRQKLAETYVKAGRAKDADKQFRQLAKAYTHDGNHRAAISVLKRLIEMQPNDAELEGQLAHGYDAGGFRKEAVPHFENAWNLMRQRDLVAAIPFGEAILRLRPDDLKFLVEMAEIVVSANMHAKGYELYMRAIANYKRRGELEAMGRMAVRALELRPDEPTLLRAAAEACLAVDDHQGALRHLQPAYARRPNDPAVLTLLADCFLKGPQPAKAKPIYLELARLRESRGEPDGWLFALTEARKLGAPGLDGAIERAELAAAQARFRFPDVPEVTADAEDILRIGVRAEVYYRYGLHDRSAQELIHALRAKHHPVVYAWAAENAAARRQNKEAVEHGTTLLSFVKGEDDRRRVISRLKTFGAVFEDEELPEDEDDDDELIDDEDDELIDDELIDDEDTAVPAPPPPAPPSADDVFREGTTDDVFSDVFKTGGTFAEVDPERLSPGFDDLDDDPFDEVETTSAEGGLEEATSLLEMGLHDEALAALGSEGGLVAAVLRARCRKEIEDARAAFDELRDVLDEADEDDEGYDAAMFVQAELAASARKPKLAVRTLKRLQKTSPSYRTRDVKKRIALLEKLLSR